MILRGSIAAEDVARTKRESYPIRHLVSPDEERGICFSDLGQEGYVLPFLLDCDEKKDSRLGQTVYYLPLRGGGNGVQYFRDNGSMIPDKRVFGIVLEEALGSLERFRRIGCFEYSTPHFFAEGNNDDKSSFPEDYDHFMELCERILSSNTGRHVVNII